MRLTPVCCSAGYWLVGLHAGAQEYIYFNLIMWICMAVGQALVVMVSTAVEDMQIANAIVTAWLALMLFFGGFFITLRDVRTHSTRSNYHPLHALSLLASSTAPLLLTLSLTFTCCVDSRLVDLVPLPVDLQVAFRRNDDEQLSRRGSMRLPVLAVLYVVSSQPTWIVTIAHTISLCSL